jgi:hypothetical protein
METIRKAELPMIDDEKQQQQQQVCNFDGYDADTLMKQMAKFRKLITKRGSLEILIPLCCTTNAVRYLKFRNTL